MFDRSAQTRHKSEVRVRLRLAGEAPFEASVFLKLDERLLDLLNDSRAFLPVRRQDGTTVIVAKSNIVAIEETVMGTSCDRSVLKGSCEKEKASRIQDEISAPDPEPDFQTPPPRPDKEEAKDEKKEEEAVGATRRGSEEKKPPRARRVIDPYDVLRVDRNASLDEIKRAYKARIKAVHPDTLAGLDLDEELERAAHLTAQRVNQAYDRILREKLAEARTLSGDDEADAAGFGDSEARETDAA